MPIAFKEWSVTVRALAEGEQLLTLRKGGIREENKHFELEHERFFLYPTFDHQRNDLVRESHHPELRRALEEGVWPDEEPPPRALLQDGGIPQPDRVRIRAWAEVADHFEIEALAPMRFTLLTERRRFPPRGRDGGGDGKRGRNLLNGSELESKAQGELAEGDRLRIETPGGGGLGSGKPTG